MGLRASQLRNGRQEEPSVVSEVARQVLQDDNNNNSGAIIIEKNAGLPPSFESTNGDIQQQPEEAPQANGDARRTSKSSTLQRQASQIQSLARRIRRSSSVRRFIPAFGARKASTESTVAQPINAEEVASQQQPAAATEQSPEATEQQVPPAAAADPVLNAEISNESKEPAVPAQESSETVDKRFEPVAVIENEDKKRETNMVELQSEEVKPVLETQQQQQQQQPPQEPQQLGQAEPREPATADDSPPIEKPDESKTGTEPEADQSANEAPSANEAQSANEAPSANEAQSANEAPSANEAQSSNEAQSANETQSSNEAQSANETQSAPEGEANVAETPVVAIAPADETAPGEANEKTATGVEEFKPQAETKDNEKLVDEDKADFKVEESTAEQVNDAQPSAGEPAEVVAQPPAVQSEDQTSPNVPSQPIEIPSEWMTAPQATTEHTSSELSEVSQALNPTNETKAESEALHPTPEEPKLEETTIEAQEQQQEQAPSETESQCQPTAQALDDTNVGQTNEDKSAVIQNTVPVPGGAMSEIKPVEQTSETTTVNGVKDEVKINASTQVNCENGLEEGQTKTPVSAKLTEVIGLVEQQSDQVAAEPTVGDAPSLELASTNLTEA